MLLQSIYKIINQHLSQQKSAPSGSVGEGKAFSKVVEEITLPASKATFAAAAKAEGMEKIELEIAAAAGLLRPIAPDPPPKLNPAAQSFDELLRTIEELKKPEKSFKLDLFE